MSQPQILRGMLVEKVFVCWECLLNVENVSGGTRRTPMKFTAELDMAALRDPQEIILGMIGKKQKRKKRDLWRFRCWSNPEGWTYFHIIFFFTFHCLDPLFEVHKGVVFNLLHSLNSTESANGTVPSISKATKICDVRDAVHLSNVSLRFSSVTVAVRFLRSWASMNELWI